MKKTLLALLLGVTLSFSLAGCGSQKPENTSASTTETVSAGTTDVESAGAAEATPAPVEAKELSSREMYEAFVNGTGKLYTHRNNPDIYQLVGEEYKPFPAFDADAGYSLDEFLKRVVDTENDADFAVSGISYTLLDCGNDGEPELALSVSFDYYYDTMIREYIIKNFDGKLELCYITESFYRYYEGLNNHYGKITGGGSGGAAYIVYDVAYLDANGDYRLVYSAEDSYAALWTLSDRYPDAVYEVLGDVDVWETEYFLTTYSFEPYDENNTEKYYSNQYLCADVSDEFWADFDVEENKAVIQSILDKAGVKLYSLAEINELIEKREKELGITEEIMEYEELDWTPVSTNLDKINGIEQIVVGTVDELMNALAPKTTVILKSGEYNVTNWTIDQIKKGNIADYYEVYNLVETDDYDYSTTPDSVEFTYRLWPEEPELCISYLDHCTIRSENPKDPARIVCTPRSANVLFLTNCEDVTIRDIVMGHTDGNDECAGDVLSLYNSSRITIDGCDLYGCGATALNISDCYNTTVTGCDIHDCTIGCVSLYNTYGFDVSDTTFHDVNGLWMFSVYSGSMYFDNCTFKDLNGEFLNNESWYVTFSNCTFDPAIRKEIENHPLYGNSVFIYED